MAAAIRYLSGASLVDLDAGAVLPGRTIEIDGDEIVSVSAVPPPPGRQGETVDLDGAFLMPGLISCHTHLSVTYPFSATDPGENPAATALRATARAREALAAGITTLRCVHEQNRADLWLRDARAKGWLELPRLFGAGRAITTPHGHGAGMGCAEASGERAFYESACEELRAGADHVKVFITGGLARAGEDPGALEMTDGELAGTVRAAEEHGSYVVAHSGSSKAIRQALAQGVSCFEHAYELDEETAALLARTGAYVTPTLCVTRNEAWQRANHFDEASIENANRAADGHLQSIRRAIAAGVSILAGTDIPPGADVGGGVPATVYEMQLLAGAGLGRLGALRAATQTPARLMGAERRLGSLAPGYRADLLAVEENPLDDLAGLARVRLVVQDGRAVAGVA